ncbi:hypothetical protein KXD93_00390 [Mucilaginibacter sp. BJC16-A38]|uniref:hypothetical protein n=1 Tax=Mucilaginibacter phenanthrenivorans TaxID=1234842 RepID=UPI002157B9C1|nr:hypothetical protein [Mucilaginibacter phenanthrenivorans]MCR8556075.1 hypothetical protein [Mucilaginibacter phenanthrenivorans]
MDIPGVVEIPSFLQSKTAKKLTFGTDGLQIEKPLSFDPIVLIPAEDISAFRYGVTWTRGYRFVIGRQYFIEIKHGRDEVFKLKLRSLYGIRKHAYNKACIAIINQLWNAYFNKILNEYIDLYNKHEVFEFVGLNFLFEGIRWDTKNKLLWSEIALSKYRTYCMVYNAENAKQHKSFTFSTDWNALIMQRLIEYIIAHPK